MGFGQSYYDYYLFTKKSKNEIVIILVYVDDLLITGNNLTLINQARGDLQQKFKMKDLGNLKFFSGIEVAIKRHAKWVEFLETFP